MDHLRASRPFLPMYIHLLFSALAPIYAGAHASLSRPSSAAKPAKETSTPDDDDSEDEEAEQVQKMEGLSPQDALIFPLTAGIVLAVLYFLIQRYGADLINLVMGWYFAVVGVYSVAALWKDGTDAVTSFVFPTYFSRGKTLYKVHSTKRRAVLYGVGDGEAKSTASPVPFVPAFNKTIYDTLWTLRSAIRQRYTTKLYISNFIAFASNTITLSNVLGVVTGLLTILYANLVAKPWYLTNLQGFAVCYQALQFLSPTTFFTGTLILSGLFFYDIWAVFFTPLMVTVAKNLDQPIKMVFPRPADPASMMEGGVSPERSYSMLGLGDIVLPGLMIGLALRFDLYMFYLKKQKRAASTARNLPDESSTKRSSEDVDKAPYISPTPTHLGDSFWTLLLPVHLRPARLNALSFPKTYFCAAVIGYIIGMIATLAVMSVWNHAQPALLYLVPGVLGSLWLTALVRGEVDKMWNFSEGLDGEQVVEDDKEKEEEDGIAEWWRWVKALVVGSAETGSKESKTEAKATDVPKEPVRKAEEAKSANVDAGKQEHAGVIVSFSIARYERASKQSPNAASTPVRLNNVQDTKRAQTALEDSEGSTEEDVVLVAKEDA
ncbi:hypothetical protein LTR62_001822 [Meristemomyces frigidus]|uniref:Signal peptide peptidase n=1 Tax=Meristemomyces frigidus TaxID=1508187 RepID=A0AAN7YI40_9PEZI|nr:hypothetical protein LTR62_001822 [Meristemomyces frigidus]